MVALLDAVARSLRAGIGIHQALADAAVVAGVHRSAIQRVSHLVGGGVPLRAALDEWRRSHPQPPVALATAVLSFSVHTGAPAARAVDGAAATLRERVVLHGEVRALAAQARASAGVVAIAPLAFTVVVSVGDPRVLAWLVGSPVGWVCLVAGVGAEMVCVVWMRSLVARAAPQ
jgi:tight adherence protein B